jgi:uncharacterized membrane protein YhaH (DUF805 family)
MRVRVGDRDAHCVGNGITNQGGDIMVRYFYAWTPLAIIAALVVLSLPWLGLIALLLVSLVALPALAFATVLLPYMAVHAVARRLHDRRDATRRVAAAMAPATGQPSLREGYVS